MLHHRKRRKGHGIQCFPSDGVVAVGVSVHPRAKAKCMQPGSFYVSASTRGAL